ncbi:glycosyltransferase [Plantibacter sp. YIM 135249]|uniref:glycosyltransferase n=1 Tax=Plantibacter sp. YIM 135249 TaxID=3423918 RepID=UPI003D3378A7
MNGLIAHEWIERIGGAERVLDSFAELYPTADLFCLWNDAPDRYGDRVVRESSLARSPMRGRKAAALPTMPAVWNDISRKDKDYDWMLVSSHLFAHHARVPKLDPARKFVYVHTPARYIWTPELDERGNSLAVRAVAPIFKALDGRRGRALQNVAANSSFVSDRIREAWGVESTVIHPPVDVGRLTAADDWGAVLDEHDRLIFDNLPETFILGASRFVPYKRLDVVIDAGDAVGVPVVIAGDGPEEQRLREHALGRSTDTHFVISPSDALLAALMQRALVYVFPPVEDFGIMPVEAMALGTPVVVNAQGGAAESVLDGFTGAHLPDFHPSTLSDAVTRAIAVDPRRAHIRAAEFSERRFAARIQAWTGVA